MRRSKVEAMFAMTDSRGNVGGWWSLLGCLATVASISACGDPDDDDQACGFDDADGVIGGDVALELTANDDGFSPAILTAQNAAKVTLTLRNAGRKPHSFVVDCLATPNDRGCPMTSCFPEASSISQVAPGASAMSTFEVPKVEGIYYFHSDVAGDTDEACKAGLRGCGQFIVK
jgi:hypothetical protein